MKILESSILIAQKSKGRSSFFSEESIDCFAFEEHELETNFDVTGWHRSTSKDTIIALKCLEGLELRIPRADGSRIGLFGGFCNGPLFYETINNQIHFDENESFNQLVASWPPRQHFKQSAPLKLSHLSLVNKFQGPMFCFTDPITCVDDSLLIAESELSGGRIDYAIIISGFSLEETQLNKLYVSFGAKELRECGIALLMTNGDGFEESSKFSKNFNFAYCSTYINRNGL